MSRRVVLYIGNHLGDNGRYPSVAQILAPHLRENIHFHLVSGKRNPFLRLVHIVYAVLRYAGRQQPVMIDTYSTAAFNYALLTATLCRLLSWNYICVLHGGSLPNRLAQFPGLCKWVFGGATQLVAPSAYLHNAFSKYGYATTIIPNPIEMEKYAFKLRTQVRPFLLWVRAFDATYNPAMAIEVVAGLKQKYPEVRLCMVGPDKDGSLQVCKELAKQRGVQDRIRFAGILSKPEWIALSAHYDIFINTTHIDNTPVSVLEAMALGFPVVSTNVGGMPYLIHSEENGILVQQASAEEMIAAIDRLCNNDSLATLLSNNARNYVRKYEMNAVVQLWKRLLC